MKKQWKLILEELDKLHEQANEAFNEADDELPEEPTDDGSDMGTDDSEDMDTDMPTDDMDSEMPDDAEGTEEPASDSDEDDTADYGLDASNTDSNGVLDELKQLYTPILIAQNYTSDDDAKDMQESMSNANCLTESNMIKFDPETQASNLIQVASLLIARSKKSEKYDAFIKAYQLVKKLKSEIRKEEEGAAKELAKQYLQQMIDGDNEDASASATKLLDAIK